MTARKAPPGLRWHALIFLGAGVALLAIHLVIGVLAWSLWVLAAWGVVLGAHYLAHKARTVDVAWVEERTEELRSKSYDASHIDTIKKDAAGAAAAGTQKPSA